MNGCRSCTDTALCRSCRRRGRSLPPEDAQTMQTTFDALGLAMMPESTPALAAITDACGDGTGAFCGDM